MTKGAYLQNFFLLVIALGLSLYWDSGKPFFLLLFWLSPDSEDDEFSS